MLYMCMFYTSTDLLQETRLSCIGHYPNLTPMVQGSDQISQYFCDFAIDIVIFMYHARTLLKKISFTDSRDNFFLVVETKTSLKH